MHVYKFRDCLLHTAERSVIKERQHLELTTKTFDVLQYLIENAGKVVSKDEILGNVWNGNFVEESNLPVHISKLRRSLSESRDCRYIETVQGTGYRFVAPLKRISEDEWQMAAANSRSRTAMEPTIGTVTNNSIAVLPLQNEGAKPDLEYLADGLTEALINGLSHTFGLKVIARDTVFRFKGKALDLCSVAKELRVSRILSGRVRVVNDDLIVGVEVVDAKDGTQMWGAQYNRPFAEIIDIQQEIVELTLGTLTKTMLGRDAVLAPQTENAESYKYFLMGTYLLNKRTATEVHKAIEYFRKSVLCSPTNARALAAIVEGYHFLYVSDRISRSETLRTIKPILDALSRLNQAIDAVHLMHGKLKLNLEWQVESAERYVRSALMQNPNFVDAHSVYAEIMIASGNSSEAIKHANHVLALDPISVSSFKKVGRIFYKLGKYNESIASLHDAHELEPCDWETLLLLGASLAELRDFDESLHFLKRSYQYYQNIETLSMIGYVEGRAGNKEKAELVIERIKSELKDHNSHAVNLARIHLAIGRKEEAYMLLEKARTQRAVDLYGISFDPRWRPLHSERRFEELIQEVKRAKNIL